MPPHASTNFVKMMKLFIFIVLELNLFLEKLKIQFKIQTRIQLNNSIMRGYFLH